MKPVIFFISMVCFFVCTRSVIASPIFGSVKRSGDVVVYKSVSNTCYALNLGTLKSRIPEVWEPLSELIITGMNSRRDLTAEEIAVCSDETVVEPVWRVARLGDKDTRPMYELVIPAGGEPYRKGTTLRALVGSVCDNSDIGYNEPAGSGKQWRYIGGQGDVKKYVVVCEVR